MTNNTGMLYLIRLSKAPPYSRTNNLYSARGWHDLFDHLHSSSDEIWTEARFSGALVTFPRTAVVTALSGFTAPILRILLQLSLIESSLRRIVPPSRLRTRRPLCTITLARSRATECCVENRTAAFPGGDLHYAEELQRSGRSVLGASAAGTERPIGYAGSRDAQTVQSARIPALVKVVR